MNQFHPFRHRTIVKSEDMFPPRRQVSARYQTFARDPLWAAWRYENFVNHLGLIQWMTCMAGGLLPEG